MADPIQLGVLDFGWLREGDTTDQILRDSFALVRRAEALGVSRYWVGEHHSAGFTSGSPQILAAMLAGSTRRIRIGVGAMLLHYWSPLRLAQDFRLLEQMYRRVDLGVARGRADNPASHRALLDGRPGDDDALGPDVYAARLEELLGHLRGDLPADHPHAGAAVLPEGGPVPEVWVCGSESAGVAAARAGARFCCTLIHGPRAPSPSFVARYRDEFRPSSDLVAPRAAIAVCGVCAETEEEAHAASQAFLPPASIPRVVGTPARCRDRIEELCAEYGVREVVLLDMASGRTRLRSLELLAGALDLRPGGAS